MTKDNHSPQKNVDTPESIQNKNSYKPLLLITLIFIGLVTYVFLTNRKVSIDWITDYQKAVELAREVNKPLLLVFYKPNAPMFVGAQNTTYKDSGVKKYVEANFIPVLINCEEQPDLAKKFGINYYPTHYVKHPDSDTLFGPRLGGDMPTLFIKEIQNLLDQLNESRK